MQFIFLSWSCGARHGWCFCRWNLVGIRVDTHLSWTDKMLRPLCHTLIQFSSPHSAPQHHSRPLMIYDAFRSSYDAVLGYFLDLESFQKTDWHAQEKKGLGLGFHSPFVSHLVMDVVGALLTFAPASPGCLQHWWQPQQAWDASFPAECYWTLANRAMFVFLHLHMVCIVHRKSMNKWMKR